MDSITTHLTCSRHEPDLRAFIIPPVPDKTLNACQPDRHRVRVDTLLVVCVPHTLSKYITIILKSQYLLLKIHQKYFNILILLCSLYTFFFYQLDRSVRDLKIRHQLIILGLAVGNGISVLRQHEIS